MVLEDEFRKAQSLRIVYKGQEIFLRHQFPVGAGVQMRIAIEAFDTDWGGLGKYCFREGVGLSTDQKIEVDSILCRLLTIWPVSPPPTELVLPVEKIHRTKFGSMHAEAGIKNRQCLWLDESFEPVEITCYAKDGNLHVWNVWNDGAWRHGIHGRHNGAGMIVEEIENGFRYRCNDGYPDEDFDDIVFRIERCPE